MYPEPELTDRLSTRGMAPSHVAMCLACLGTGQIVKPGAWTWGEILSIQHVGSCVLGLLAASRAAELGLR